MRKPTVLIIIDGWGYSEKRENNAVALAKTPVMNSLLDKYPHGLLQASGLDVGLPAGVMGNSEVGHTNIGAGRVVYQDLTRIDKSIEDGSFFNNEVILSAFQKATEAGGKVHLLGLLSDGGVHSHWRHLEALIDLAKRHDVADLVIHPIMDGRDTAPMIGEQFIVQLQNTLQKFALGRIGTLSGRYYTMDRDTRWERIEQAFVTMTLGQPLSDQSPVDYLKKAYQDGIGDEFILPACFDATATIADNDAVIFFNYRSDRARQITRAFTEEKFDAFHANRPKLSAYVCMTEYDESFHLPVAFPSPEITNTLGEVVAGAGLKQLRIAETEKYAHVTFFFNGGREVKFEGEDRILVESPRDVKTYDLKPEMSAMQITDKLIPEIDAARYDLIVLNFANCDMVGHTGHLAETIRAVETVDLCLGKIVDHVLKKDGLLFITADHGNAETMVDEEGRPFTAHTTNPVRYLLVTDDPRALHWQLHDGRLADVMPTLLKLMNLPTPPEVTGKPLFD